MMRKFGLIFLAIFLSLGLVRFASAHTFLTDGDITVLLHTNPDDDPIAGQPAAMLFQITDSTGKFNSSKCNCNVSIAKDSQVLLSAALLPVVGDSVYDLTQPFMFPEKAVYQITVTGAPKVGSSFQSFSVQYDLRVDRTAASSQTSAKKFNFWWLVAAAAGVGVIVFAGVYFKGKR